tara:strand:+ start:178 stop:495 length:318 start_codon:yes stop_codon:yes gene_type:complete
MDKTKIIVAVVIMGIITFLVVRANSKVDYGSIGTAEACAEHDGSWVDTSTDAGCVAAGGEWSEDTCSLGSYCEATATEEVEESEVEETKTEDEPESENTEPTEGQ